MPTYSYRCANCDHAFDQYQAFTDDSLTVCPDCHQPQLRKVFNSIGVTFNGTGFYRTDARADAKAASAKSSGSGESSSRSGSKPETKSESKPDSAPSTPKKAPAAVSSSASSSSS